MDGSAADTPPGTAAPAIANAVADSGAGSGVQSGARTNADAVSELGGVRLSAGEEGRQKEKTP